MNNCNNCPPKKQKTCKKDVQTCSDISLPVKLEPVTIVGEIETTCCGEPHIICKNNCENNCEIVITQTVCIVIPIEYGVKAIQGKSNIKCIDKSCL
jgi:hypothetical protein